MIRANKVGFEYIRRDAQGSVTEIKRALDGVDLHIRPGQFVAILGANGSGKSTFAKHLNALLVPEEGSVIVDGIDTSDSEHYLTIRQTAGMVFQNPDNQIISNVVEEDVAFGPENMGVLPQEIENRVTTALGQVGMEKYRFHSPNHLSGGQKQKVSIAGILAMKPKCIIMDEATAMLDPQGRKSVLKTVQKCNQQDHLTVIWITHYMEEVVEADYAYVMNAGKVALEGTPTRIFEHIDVLRECRLEIPKMVAVAEKLRKRGIPVPGRILKQEDLVDWLISYRERGMMP